MQFEEEADQMPEMAMDGIQVHFERRIGEFCKVFELLNQTVELAYFGIPESPIESPITLMKNLETQIQFFVNLSFWESLFGS